MAVNRSRPTAPGLANRVAPVAASSSADPAADHESAHGHAHGHAHGGEAHGPKPRPRRSSTQKSSKKRRKSAATGLSEDNEPELHEPEEHATGVAAVSGRDEQADGGDDQDEGGEERSRHGRTAFANRILRDTTAEHHPVADRKRQAHARQAFEKAIAAAKTGREFLEAQLAYARALEGAPSSRGARLGATKDRLVATCPRPGPDAGSLTEAERRLNLMRVMADMQAHAPRSSMQRYQQLAHLESRQQAALALSKFMSGWRMR